MTNWKNRLKSKLEDLAILFQEDCTEEDALQAWYGFFNHEFWNEQPAETSSYSAKVVLKSVRVFADTEQFIEEQYPVNCIYYCKVSCKVLGNGWRPTPLPEFLKILKCYGLDYLFEK